MKFDAGRKAKVYADAEDLCRKMAEAAMREAGIEPGTPMLLDNGREFVIPFAMLMLAGRFAHQFTPIVVALAKDGAFAGRSWEEMHFYLIHMGMEQAPKSSAVVVGEGGPP